MIEFKKFGAIPSSLLEIGSGIEFPISKPKEGNQTARKNSGGLIKQGKQSREANSFLKSKILTYYYYYYKFRSKKKEISSWKSIWKYTSCF